MARINIDDSLFSDPRYQDLITLVGSKEMALGIVVQAWIVAQKFWLQNRRGIPKPEWEKLRLSPTLFDVKLAWFDDEFVYVAGSREQFKWLEQRSVAGKKGGPAASRARAEKIGKSNRRTTTGDDGTRPLTLPLSLTLSHSPALSQERDAQHSASGGQGSVDPAGEVRNPVGYFIAAYANAYKTRYGISARPVISGKTQGQIKRLLADTPLDRACELVSKYCEMGDHWFLTKAHDFGTFIENQNKIALALDTGRTISRAEAAGSDKEAHWKAQAERIAAGEL